MGLLRLWLALCVVSTHSGSLWGFSFMRGGDAVVTFFVLAGFFAAYMMDTRYRGRYQVFYLNRLLRVWPLYLLALAFSLVVITAGVQLGRVLIGPASILPYIKHYPASHWVSAWGLSQFFLLGQDVLAFSHLDPVGDLHLGCGYAASILMMNLALIPQAWSLALEEYFYLLAPWLERLGLKVSGAILLLWMLAYKPLEARCDRVPLYFFPVAVALFIGGNFAYRCYQRWLAHPVQLARWRPWILAAYTLFILSAPYVSLSPPWTALAAALAVPMVFDAFKDVRWDRWLGDLSYPVYLFHKSVGWLVVWMWPEAPKGTNDCPQIMAGTLMLAVVVALVVETPLRKYRAKLANVV